MRNVFDGRADAVVQAGQVYGGVHFHLRRRRGIIAGAAVGVAALLFTGFVAPGFFITSETPPASEKSSAESSRPASETGGGRSYSDRQLLQTSPDQSVRMVYQRIADGTPDVACGQFTVEAAQQFADHFLAPTCTIAVETLHLRIGVSWRNAYVEPRFPQDARILPSSASEVVISSCRLEFAIDGLPEDLRLGGFTVRKSPYQGQWIIAGHQRESC